LLKFYFSFDLNPQQPFELPVLPAVSLCYAVSATLHTSDSMRIEQFPYFAPNLSASPIADALCWHTDLHFYYRTLPSSNLPAAFLQKFPNQNTLSVRIRAPIYSSSLYHGCSFLVSHEDRVLPSISGPPVWPSPLLSRAQRTYSRK
jgi:hypothetical protein